MNHPNERFAIRPGDRYGNRVKRGELWAIATADLRHKCSDCADALRAEVEGKVAAE